jgi:hypothetical protein
MAWGWAAVLLKGLLKGTCSQRSGVESSYVELMHVLLHLGLGKDREDKGLEMCFCLTIRPSSQVNLSNARICFIDIHYIAT